MKYDDSSIRVLDDITHLRLRPLMYISAEKPTLQMFEEIFSNSLDEAINGYAQNIEVVIDYEESLVSVTDDGRGLPLGINPTMKKSTVEVIYTKLNSGGKYDSGSYAVSGGLHGVGSCVVNALSSILTVSTWRGVENKQVTYQFEKGIKKYDSEVPCKGTNSGTSVRFYIDTSLSLFDNDALKDHEKEIQRRMEFVATMYPSLKLTYQNELVKSKPLSAYVKADGQVLREAIEIRVPGIDLALNWNDSLKYQLPDSYCNLIHTYEGGDHVKGLELALQETFQDQNILLGMDCLLATTYPQVEFVTQTKSKVKSATMRDSVDELLGSELVKYLKKNPKVKEALTEMLKRKKEELDKRAGRKATQKKDRRNSFLSTLTSEGFADCTTRDRSKAELLICEGLSAAGSLKQARDIETQAVLPLRGKFINAITATSRKALLQNQEVSTLLTNLNTGAFEDYDVEKSRYDKVVIFTDADPDGQNIACLLIAFFAKVLPQFLLSGKLYLALPPLYGTTIGSKFYPIYSEEEKQDYLKKGHEVQRYKGLGEMMPEQLRVSCLDKETRRLVNLVAVGEEDLSVIEKIMGGDSAVRKLLLQEMGVFK